MKLKVLILFFISLLLTACSQTIEDPISTEPSHPETNTPTLEPLPTETPEPPLTLTVCTAALPNSLFRYDGSSSPSKENILALIQGDPFEEIKGEGSPLILEKVPAQADGDLRLEPIIVQGGQPIVDGRGELAVLKPGILVRPSGCHQADCAITWDGETPLEMDRMVIDFRLKEGLTWSNGEPVTAADSSFSYRLASAEAAPGLKWAEERTDSYGSIGTQTVQWVGRPGFTNAQLEQFFWSPLPSHLFDGGEGWGELRGEERLTTYPLSYGPFVVSTWGTGFIRLEPNPHYDGSDQGLLALDEVTFRALEGDRAAAWAALQSGECDVLDISFGLEKDPDLLELIREDEDYVIQFEPGGSWTQLVFGIQPASYDDFGPLGDSERPDFFGDERVRKGIAHCLDREKMLEVTLGGLGGIWPSFLPPDQSQLDSSAMILHDPALGLQYLTEAGWLDHDDNPETPLQAWRAANVPPGTSLEVALLVSESPFHQDLGRIIEDSLQACGVDVSLTMLPAEELYAPGPEGPLFGRQFDLTLLSWQAMPELDCGLYLGWEIPKDENQWIGTNIAGLSDEDYDQACLTASLALPDAYAESLALAEEIFINTLPTVPLFSPPNITVWPAPACPGEDMIGGESFYRMLDRIHNDSGCP